MFGNGANTAEWILRGYCYGKVEATGSLAETRKEAEEGEAMKSRRQVKNRKGKIYSRAKRVKETVIREARRIGQIESGR